MEPQKKLTAPAPFFSPAASRIIPFAVFMGCIAGEELLVYLGGRGLVAVGVPLLQWLYLPRVLFTALALLVFRSAFTEIRVSDLRHPGHTAASLLVGSLIFVLWINLDMTFSFQGVPRGFEPQHFIDEANRTLMVAVRVIGAVAVVPVMEELFWRSWLLRYLIRADFITLPVGSFTPFSFLVTSVLFGLEHHFIVAGIMAGVLFNLLCHITGSIAQCILAHAVANLLLAGYVLATNAWRFW